MTTKEHDPARGPQGSNRPPARTQTPQDGPLAASRPPARTTKDELLDHEADGIREFDNALPRWWLYGFYFTIAFAVVYMINYHVLPTPWFGKPGMAAEYRAELDAARKSAPTPTPLGSATAALAVLTDGPNLAKGRAIFENTDNVCSSCHRPDLGGMVGPNLTDDHWLHGCSVQEVVVSIKNGYPLKGMMPFGTGKPLNDEQLLQLASYVISKHGSSPANPKPIDAGRDVVCERRGTP
jgi:cytochrome c oxidase cbb3-type subunit III